MIRTLRSSTPPPRDIPAELGEAYTLNGAVPVQRLYFNDIVDGPLVWTPSSRWWRPDFVARRVERYYGATDRYLYAALDDFPIDGRDVVIVGSEMPWYECICATRSARVTTIEYRRVDCRIQGLTMMTPNEFVRAPRRFDAVVSISSVEHDGLGRYGDPLRPDGDLTAMRAFRDLLKPDGVLILAVPVGPDLLVWNAHRIYGPRRLPLLLQEWSIAATYGFAETDYRRTLGDYEHQPVFVLRPRAEAVEAGP
ncbi:MAG: DUF268 domain-containing protein [Pirellulales bacterium]